MDATSATPNSNSNSNTNSNPLRTAFSRLTKKAEKSGFFRAKSKATPAPGSIRQVRGAQLPPVWKMPPPLPSQISSDTSASSTDQESVENRQQYDEKRDQLEEKNHSDLTSNHKSQQKSDRSAGDNIETSRQIGFREQLNAEDVDLDKLRALSWGGIPKESRPVAWQLLLGYAPFKQDRRSDILCRKRQEYIECVQQYYDIPDSDRSMEDQNTLRQILVDLPRTCPDIPVFHQTRTQQCMERILYIWAIRHPASGYVQGINDLLTPFFLVFLSSVVDNPRTCDIDSMDSKALEMIEADCYWCLAKLLDGIQDHYTFAQPGLQRMVHKMEELVHRCDADLHKHIVESEGVQFVQFAFRWMNCLLLREIPIAAIIRLWDTYLSEDGGFERFHVYVCAAILMTFGDKLKEMNFQELVMFLQSLPTQQWTEHDVEPLLSRAYILKSYFEDAPSHLN